MEKMDLEQAQQVLLEDLAGELDQDKRAVAVAAISTLFAFVRFTGSIAADLSAIRKRVDQNVGPDGEFITGTLVGD